MKAQLLLKVYGLVQGVNFRYETKKIADNLNISGYVKNLNDRTVEILAIGPNNEVQKLAEWVKSGPNYAKVDKVLQKVVNSTEKFDKFEILY